MGREKDVEKKIDVEVKKYCCDEKNMSRLKKSQGEKRCQGKKGYQPEARQKNLERIPSPQSFPLRIPS